MNQAEITRIVNEALAKDPALMIREFLEQQIWQYQEHIRYDQANIRRLRKELTAVNDLQPSDSDTTSEASNAPK